MGTRWTMDDIVAKGLKISNSGIKVSKNDIKVQETGTKLPNSRTPPGGPKNGHVSKTLPFAAQVAGNKGRAGGSKKPRKPKHGPSANSLTKECLCLLHAAGYEAWRNNNAGVWDPQKKIFRKGSARKGVPDIIGYHRKTGRACWVEVKAGKDRLSKEQKRFLDDAKRAGCAAFEYRGREDIMTNLNINF